MQVDVRTELLPERAEDAPAARAGAKRSSQPSALERLSELLFELYPLALACPIGEFEPRLFELLCKTLDFDAGWVGRVALTPAGPVLHNSYLHRLPMAFATAWEQAKLDDPILLRIGTKIDLPMTMSSDDPDMSAAFRAIVRHYGLAYALVCIREDRALGLHTFLSLYRRSPDKPFGAAEKRLVSLLVQHVASATDLNRVNQIDRIKATGGERVAVAICDTLGILQYADDAFVGQMRREWPDWVGPTLPASMVVAGAARHAGHAGREVRFEVSPVAELLVIRAWAKSAVDGLSPRERTVAQLYADGSSYKEVARRLGLAPATVRNQLREAYRKLGVQDKGQIASLLSRHGPV